MRASDPEVVDAVWAAVEGLLPVRARSHPLGCHRPRVSDKLCFRGLLIRLVTGSSWVDIEAILEWRVSDTTLRARRDEWIAAGVFDRLRSEAVAAFDRIVGLDLSEVAVDGSLHKAPCGGAGTVKSPVDRGKLGWKWSVAAERHGVPVGWAIDGANRNDIRLLEPTLAAINSAGLLEDIETLHLDRGYDYPAVRRQLKALGIADACIQRRTPNTGPRRPLTLGLRWIVESTNSWLSNYGQLRRNTDRKPDCRHAAMCLATTILITAKLIDWKNRWNPT
ncbi:IS5 family transposase [Candidatus Poriferisocius sp.]|uniref:IS5 family transposase n=1 Tax=Candidatus Poriferisocius sp. TaxID=3101276 RepID=UPI003B591655